MTGSSIKAAVTTTIFERISRLAAEAGAINLGQGFPEMDEPPELIAAAQAALAQRSNQYPPMRGLPELRRAIGGYYRDTQSLTVDEAQIVVTSGATEALAASILALVRPGDEVILVHPMYDAYLPLGERAGGTARFVSLQPPDWRLPLDAVEAAIGPGTRAIILNTPNNPTGTLIDAVTLEALGALCVKHDLTVISDEVWEAMLFKGARHVSPMTIAGLRDRTVKIGSAGKLFSMTGWKVGWACAAPPLADRIAASHQFLTFTTAPALQWAVAEGFSLGTNWHADHLARYDAARRRLLEGLDRAGFSVLPDQATWFVTIDLAASGVALDDVAFCERIITEAGVAAIPVSAFYEEAAPSRYVRLCFAKEDDMLDTAIARLGDFRKAAT